MKKLMVTVEYTHTVEIEVKDDFNMENEDLTPIVDTYDKQLLPALDQLLRSGEIDWTSVRIYDPETEHEVNW
jgi:hypothetical protein